jgi:HEPN domain
MNVIDAEIRRKVLQWLNYADEDIQLARHALTLSTAVPYRLVAYHAQQCAEKALKAYLVRHRIDFPYTHNMIEQHLFCKFFVPLWFLCDVTRLPFLMLMRR